jgi:aryl-alcohol dehydrogenase-like predicted oxidoreductase
MMEQVVLGRTGLKVTRLGLGGGGHSRLGQSTGRNDSDSVAIVRRALDCGINFIDTAEGYGTEEIVGQGIRGRDRSRIVLSTKKSLPREKPVSAAELRDGLEQSLRRLGTDYLDIYHLHGLKREQYDHAITVLVPEMMKFKQQGKIRAVGVTEAFNSDRGHEMLGPAMADDCWDVIMVGFNILNQSARQRVLETARRKNIGVLCMFAVRTALSQPQRLREIVGELIDSGKLDPAKVDRDNPLGFLTRDGVAGSVVEAAYRFCRDEPGIHVVLSGTGELAHLDQNIQAIKQPPLPPHVRESLVNIFEGIDSVSAQ